MNHRILIKLQSAWESAPDTPFGALVEQVEDLAWRYASRYEQHVTLSGLSDGLFEKGLDEWMAVRGVGTAGGWKS